MGHLYHNFYSCNQFRTVVKPVIVSQSLSPPLVLVERAGGYLSVPLMRLHSEDVLQACNDAELIETLKLYDTGSWGLYF